MCSRRGFTLIEISIVLVIVALLAAGIVVAQDLIEQFRQRKLISEVNQYVIAHQQFKNKFGALPGDFNRAFQLWGTACGPTAVNCNGDNDGIVYEDQYSPRRTWVHLSLSGLIGDVNYGPMIAAGGGTPGGYTYFRPGVDMPRAPYNGESAAGTGIDEIQWWSTYIISTGFASNNLTDYGRTRPNVFWLAGLRYSAPGSVSQNGTVLTPLQAYSIDAKMDDGVADGGKVITVNGRTQSNGGNPANCVSPNGYANAQTTGTYNLTTDPGRQSCAMGFDMLY